MDCVKCGTEMEELAEDRVYGSIISWCPDCGIAIRWSDNENPNPPVIKDSDCFIPQSIKKSKLSKKSI